MTKFLPWCLGLFIGIFVLFIIIQLAVVWSAGTPVAIPNIPREPRTIGSGQKLTYIVMGDSTAISQGSTYDEGFAIASANYLATKYTVTFVNTAISGATVSDVVKYQLPTALSYKPDVVLISAGANDTTKFSSKKSVMVSMQRMIDELTTANPNVAIVVTGSPAMDSVSRFPYGFKLFMGIRTSQINSVFDTLIEKNSLIHAPIALKTREAFLADPSLFASDKFHPNGRGYSLWIPVINAALDKAVQRQK